MDPPAAPGRWSEEKRAWEKAEKESRNEENPSSSSLLQSNEQEREGGREEGVCVVNLFSLFSTYLDR